MAAPTNTISRYSTTRSIREQLENKIYDLSPTDRPLTANIKTVKATNTFVEWQTSTLATPVANNAQIEGDNFTAIARTQPARVGNYTQISAKGFITSGTARVVNTAGYDDIYVRELGRVGQELLLDIEASCYSNLPANVGGAGTARVSAGLQAWLTSNTNGGAGAVNPTLSGGANGSPATGRTAGTSRPFTETILKDALRVCRQNGGKPKMLLTTLTGKQTVSGFAGIAQNRVDIADREMGMIIGAADIYVSDYGQLAVVPSTHMSVAGAAPSTAFLIDKNYIHMANLRPVHTQKLAKTGDADQVNVVCEWTLQVNNEKAQAGIYDLSNA